MAAHRVESGPGAGTASRPTTGLWALLAALTLATGLVDAVSYLGLGHVFVANMTGNIVFMGFALAGAKGFSLVASLVALAAFLLGAGIGGRMGAAWAHRPRRWWLAAATGAQAALAVTVAVATAAGALGDGGNVRFAVIALLAVGTGLQNATIRRLAIPDVTTTVLTQTLTGLAADSTPAGGSNPRAYRRLMAVAAMLAGAVAGAALMLHQGFTTTLGVAAGVLAAIAVGFAVLSERELGPFRSRA
jgi:uncharacterized membrane protein YoaK (UPF0700 family)